jgi:hypothetical protein
MSKAKKKCPTKLVDAQLEKKMHVKVKQLALEETCEIPSNSSAAPKIIPKKSLGMGLNDKNELATYITLLKKQQKENNNAMAAL